ncbi:HupE/UreJ family protein [Paenibacillus sp. MWE-103]|uniref:HupE/UreJ family protein n=1 Tax=Paenibacillus artemisiicola TaxID=1172618 RepID=A0ABS3W850_9BACL|nr:HupE/UreJ family protein [Paenibacillus artemisiicola]MBO7744489.1 HupE/UreJ family protein [Paenibacillus artemisiicola]
MKKKRVHRMRRQGFKKLAALFLGIALLLFAATPVFAHDLYLGSSKWAFGKDRILSTIEFDPGLFEQIKGIKELGYDLDHLTEEQLRDLTTKVIQPYIDEKLSVSINDRVYPEKVVKLEREGTLWKIWLKISDLNFDWQENQVSIAYHLLFEETSNQHVNIGYVYYTDADDDAVQAVFDKTQPNLQYIFDSNHTVWNFSDKTAAFLTDIATFVVLGIKHILTGYDHIAFLLALIVIGLSVREAIKIITSFTVAHSITLLLAAMNIVNLNAKFVESVIALSICYIAVENLFSKQVNYRWLVTFMFGLVHGFGFASVLREYVADKENLVRSVVSFNVGVELGQLAILLVALPLLYLIRKRFSPRTVTVAASAAIFLVGFLWFVDRLFNLQWVPF